jgi:NhaC family Na+:H+ antiporter
VQETSVKPPALWQALFPVAALVLFLVVQISIFDGPPHIPLILASIVAALMGLRLGHPWHEIENGIVDGIAVALKAILILMVVGILIGTWIAGGIVPVLIDYGLRLLSPTYFLLAACLICSIVSIATGSSWTTAGTVGVALIGIGEGLGVSLPMTAGAIISGAYFGDKMSPLSDSTNLSPAVAGAELFDHIQYMVYTALPAYVLAIVLYGILGFSAQTGSIEGSQVEAIRSALGENFNLSPILLLPPLLVIAAVAFRIPALPALIGGALLGALMALWVQDSSLQQVVEAAHSGYQSETGFALVDNLLTRGGLESMMSTVALVLCALTFGGIMERTGLLRRLADAILRKAHSTGSLVLATLGSCIGTNVIAPDQYMSIVVPGRMYRETFEDRGLAPVNLSRALESGGTLSSPLVPWNTCGAFMSTTLMVSAAEYFPYAFVNLITPVIVVIVSYAGFRIARLPDASLEVTPEQSSEA